MAMPQRPSAFGKRPLGVCSDAEVDIGSVGERTIVGQRRHRALEVSARRAPTHRGVDHLPSAGSEPLRPGEHGACDHPSSAWQWAARLTAATLGRPSA